MSIRVRITAWHVAFVALLLAGVALFVVVRLRSDLTDSIDRSLQPAAGQIASGYHAEGAAEFRDTASTVLSGERALAQVLDARGRVVLMWGDPVARTPLLHGSSLAAAMRAPPDPRTVQRGFRVAARPVTRHGRPEVVVAAVSTAPVDRSVHRVIVLLALALPAALLLMMLGGWWLARRALRPIDSMTVAAAAIGVDRLGERVAEPARDDEVGRLAATFNAMLERIERGVAEQQRLIADASHELRTPLAAMRSELDVSLRLDDLSSDARAVLESMREEVDRLSRTVDDLLTLAAADAGRLSVERTDVAVHGVVAEVVAAAAPLAEQKRVVVTISGADAHSRTDPAALRHALRNLLENAIEFSEPGGHVELVTEASNAHVAVMVRDEGPGIAADHKARVFERFYRVDPSRARSSGGTGLGLAIADELVRAAGGRIRFEANEPRGSVFVLELPCAPTTFAMGTAPD